MRRLPSRFHRLDGALADLPLEEPMLLTELDGFLTALLVSPARVPPDEWMRNVWGPDGDVPPFDDPEDVRWFADAVAARQDEIARDLARGRLQPILDVDARDGETIWEGWIDGFAEAVDLRPDAWASLADGSDRDTADALSRIALLVAVARGESDLDSVEINALQDRAPTDLADAVLALHAARLRAGGNPGPIREDAAPDRIGRNEPCPCGSGKKFKRCCG